MNQHAEYLRSVARAAFARLPDEIPTCQHWLAAEEIERLERRVSELEGRAAVPPVDHQASDGITCPHCQATGKALQVYDEQTGWSDEEACETCSGAGRITTVEQYLKTVPANWHEDSSLETWFPLLADQRAAETKDERRESDREKFAALGVLPTERPDETSGDQS